MSDLLGRLQSRADAMPSRIAFSDDTGDVAYGALLRRIGAMAVAAGSLPGVVGVLGANCIDWVVADLGCKWAGRTVVPLPPFFSPAQLAHVVQDAGIAAVLATEALMPLASGLGLPVAAINRDEATPPPLRPGWRSVAYSSGSTGNPKGALLGDRQADRVAVSLAAAIAGTGKDVYLSLLPLALLLEQVAAIHVPLVVGGRTILSATLPVQALRGQGDDLAEAVRAHRPTVLSITPHILSGLSDAFRRDGARAPASLRVVAVGGAALPVPLARAAIAQGIPVHEGYGLTECGSVVAVNRFGERREGTVGRPLDGVELRLVDGEIVVSGASVMDGYLNGAPAGSTWHTGDMGAIDPDGNLVVLGRKDAMLVTSLGRNISPEWVEAAIQADPCVKRCVLLADGGPWPVAIVELVPDIGAGPGAVEAASVEALVWATTAAMPDYARPRRVVLAGERALANDTLFTANGRPRRKAIAQAFDETIRGEREPILRTGSAS
jgi:long-chain acyl-CoA synthetase